MPNIEDGIDHRTILWNWLSKSYPFAAIVEVLKRIIPVISVQNVECRRMLTFHEHVLDRSICRTATPSKLKWKYFRGTKWKQKVKRYVPLSNLDELIIVCTKLNPFCFFTADKMALECTLPVRTFSWHDCSVEHGRIHGCEARWRLEVEWFDKTISSACAGRSSRHRSSL